MRNRVWPGATRCRTIGEDTAPRSVRAVRGDGVEEAQLEATARSAAHAAHPGTRENRRDRRGSSPRPTCRCVVTWRSFDGYSRVSSSLPDQRSDRTGSAALATLPYPSTAQLRTISSWEYSVRSRWSGVTEIRFSRKTALQSFPGMSWGWKLEPPIQ